MEINFNTNSRIKSYNNGAENKARKISNGLDVLGPEAPDKVKETWDKAEKTFCSQYTHLITLLYYRRECEK